MNKTDLDALKQEVEFTGQLLVTVNDMGRMIVDLLTRVAMLERQLEAVTRQGLIELDSHPRSEEVQKH